MAHPGGSCCSFPPLDGSDVRKKLSEENLRELMLSSSVILAGRHLRRSHDLSTGACEEGIKGKYVRENGCLDQQKKMRDMSRPAFHSNPNPELPSALS